MKIIIRLGAVLVVLVAVAIVVGVRYVDRVAQVGIERAGSYALGVPTSLESADVGLLSGEFTMSGLTVANPQGFEGPHFLHLKDGRVAVTLGTLRDDLVVLPTLALDGTDVVLDRRNGKSNYEVILENLKQLESDKPSGDEPAGDEDGKRFVIRKVKLTDISVHVTLLPMGGELTKLTVPIEKIVINDVGTGSNKGVLLSELSSLLTKAVLAAVADNVGKDLPGDMLGSLQGGLAQLQPLSDMSIEMGADLGKQLDAAKDLAGEAQKAAEGLGGLFGGDKDKKDDQ